MPDGKWWVDYAAQSVIHALIAALAIEALLRLWRARAPGDRLALRLLGLGQPLLVTPLLFALAPVRRGERFSDVWALFAARRWQELPVLGTTAFHLALGLAAAVGMALFLMDALPLLSRRRRALPPAAPPPIALEAALADALAATAGSLRSARARRPRLHFIAARGPALFCAGLGRPVLVVSQGALDLLDGEELRAALGHELAHLDRHDPALSWAAMAARALLFFNPVAQVSARALARDAEWLADERAGGDRLALAAGLLKLHRAGLAGAGPARRSLPFAGALSEPLRRVRSHDVEARCRRLLEPAPPPALVFRSARLAATAAALAGLTFLVA
jgi:Zn-dependent protease with chaperone function